jgi:hypothetical protein
MTELMQTPFKNFNYEFKTYKNKKRLPIGPKEDGDSF